MKAVSGFPNPCNTSNPREGWGRGKGGRNEGGEGGRGGRERRERGEGGEQGEGEDGKGFREVVPPFKKDTVKIYCKKYILSVQGLLIFLSGQVG